jgi:type IV secretory pathway TrbL component
MNTSILDTITAAFVSALQSGAGALAQYSLPLLGVFALIALYIQIGPLVASGGGGAGDALASVLLTAIKTGVFYWLLVNLNGIATAAFLTFLQWGITPTGGGMSAASFLAPSRVMDVGFAIGKPIREFTNAWISWAAVWNWPMLLTYSLAFYAILISFMAIALHLMMTIIEYNMAALVGTVLIPWGVLQPTAFFTEFSIGWLTGGLVRVLVTTGMIGIAVPLFALVRFNTTAGGDPTFYSAVVCAVASVIFAILSWVVPGRAAAIAGRGVSLALHGGTIVAGAAGGARGVLLVTSAVRGVSHMLRR